MTIPNRQKINPKPQKIFPTDCKGAVSIGVVYQTLSGTWVGHHSLSDRILYNHCCKRDAVSWLRGVHDAFMSAGGNQL